MFSRRPPRTAQKSGSHVRMGVGGNKRWVVPSRGCNLPVSSLLFLRLSHGSLCDLPGDLHANWITYWRRSTELATLNRRAKYGSFRSLFHRSSLIWRNQHDSNFSGFPHRTCKGILSIGLCLNGSGTASTPYSTPRRPPLSPHCSNSAKHPAVSPISKHIHAECRNSTPVASIVETPHACTRSCCR
jgi:hypothetical protein